MPGFDLNVWNKNAEAQLFAEYQEIAARDPAEKTRGVFQPTSSGSKSLVAEGSTAFGSRLLRSTSFTMANTIICELPAVFVTNDRVGAVRVMIGKVVASAAVTLSAECTVEIERALLDQCEHIAASCVASDGEKQAAGSIKVRSTYPHPMFRSVSFGFFPVSLHPDPLRADVCDWYRIHLCYSRGQRIHLALAIHHRRAHASLALFADRSNVRNPQL